MCNYLKKKTILCLICSLMLGVLIAGCNETDREKNKGLSQTETWKATSFVTEEVATVTVTEISEPPSSEVTVSPTSDVPGTEKTTLAPTAIPTVTPTANVTSAPTQTATPVPTIKPTASPTIKPTATPTATPIPTAKPTAVPTVTQKPVQTPAPTPTSKPVPEVDMILPGPVCDWADESSCFFGKLLISEVCSKNDGFYLSSQNTFTDWVEIRNLSNEPLELNGLVLYLTGKRESQVSLDGITVEAGEYLVLCGDKMNFTLASEGGTVTLLEVKEAKKYKIDETILKTSEKSLSFVKSEIKGEVSQTIYMTPGYPNTEDGYIEFCKNQETSGPLIINEVAVSNDKVLKQSDGEFYDWIEIKNISSATVKLSDYAISDKDGKLKYTLPSVDVKPGGLYVIICSSGSGYDSSGFYHANFSISAAAEAIYLYKKSDKTLIDSLYITEVPLNGTFGRMANEKGGFYFAKPTPKAENQGGSRFICEKPGVNIAPGIYSTSSLEITLNGEGDIYYTIDGSDPTDKDIKYVGPIKISQNTVIRAIVYKAGKLPCSPTSFSYFINPGTELPIISLVTDPDNLWSDETGIYVKGNHDNYNQRWERPATVTYINGNKGFTIDCGVKLHGNGTRVSYEKKSFRLHFKGKYGADSLDYNLFDNGACSFDSVILRAGEDYRRSIFRNEMATKFQEKYMPSLITQTGHYCSLYINGEYFGIYFLQERLTEYNVSVKTGVPEDEITVEAFNPAPGTELYELMQFAKNNDLSIQANFDYIADRIDMESFTDWLIYEAYVGNTDIIANVRYVKPGKNAKWVVSPYDYDWSMLVHDNAFERIIDDYHWYTSWLIQGVVENEGYREYFLDRLAYHLKYTFKAENMSAIYKDYYAIIKPEVAKERAKWGKSVEHWEQQAASLQAFFTSCDRGRELVNSIAKVFDLNALEVIYYFG